MHCVVNKVTCIWTLSCVLGLLTPHHQESICHIWTQPKICSYTGFCEVSGMTDASLWHVAE
jgi:hypothetical protein